jgi:imidazolonepropionase-like amidohydrolase
MMINQYVKIVVIACFPLTTVVAQKSFAISGATLHLGNGKKIDSGFIGVRDGKIVQLVDLSASSIPNEEFDTLYRANGKHVYPGFILLNSTLGLTDVESVRATHDFAETVLYSPEVVAGYAFNAESNVPATVARNGVLVVQSVPRGSWVAGRSSTLMLNSQPYPKAVLKMEQGLHLYWPTYPVSGKKEDKIQLRNTLIDGLKRFFYECSTEQPKRNQSSVYAAVLNGGLRLFVHVNKTREIAEVLSFIREFKIASPVIVGGMGSEALIPDLKTLGVSVIMERIYELPGSFSGGIHDRVQLLKKLNDAGITVAIDYAGDMEAMGARNLPFTAGYLTGDGISEESALQFITGNAAKILGLQKQIGTLAVGKDATLFVSSGSALEIMGNHVENAWAQGVRLQIETRQESLRKAFCD